MDRSNRHRGDCGSGCTIWDCRAAPIGEHAGEATQAASIPSVNVDSPCPLRALRRRLRCPATRRPIPIHRSIPRTSGYLKNWYFDIGAHVRKGQLMAQIETPELDQQLQVAQADLKSAQANLDLANTTSARYQNLLKTNSVSKQETDVAMSDAAGKEGGGGCFDGERAQTATAAIVREDLRAVRWHCDGAQHRYRPIDLRRAKIRHRRSCFILPRFGRSAFRSVPEAYSDLHQTGGKATLTLDEYPGQEHLKAHDGAQLERDRFRRPAR